MQNFFLLNRCLKDSYKVKLTEIVRYKNSSGIEIWNNLSCETVWSKLKQFDNNSKTFETIRKHFSTIKNLKQFFGDEGHEGRDEAQAAVQTKVQDVTSGHDLKTKKYWIETWYLYNDVFGYRINVFTSWPTVSYDTVRTIANRRRKIEILEDNTNEYIQLLKYFRKVFKYFS